MKKLLCVGLSTLLLTGCVSTELSTQGKTYNPATDARVRLYGQNRKPSIMKVKVNGKIEKITVGGGFGQAFNSMLYLKDNESIGMPATELSKDPSSHTKLFSDIFYKEFVIPAGDEVTVSNSIEPLQNTLEERNFSGKVTKIEVTTVLGCKGNEVSFKPQAGKDYEVAPISSDAQCGVTVYEIK